MTTYIMLANWTEQGARNVNASPSRLDAAKQALKEMGGEFKAFFMTMGKYDMVIVCEAPDDAVQARLPATRHARQHPHSNLKAFPRRPIAKSSAR